MDKKALINKYFQKAHLLHVRNSFYTDTLSSLFQWLVANDSTCEDKTTNYLKIKSVSKACIISRQELLLSGLEEIAFLLTKHTHLKIKTLYKDGQLVRSGNVIAEIEGNTKEILALERTILNLLQRMSGIATATRHLINFIKQSSTKAMENKQPTTYNTQLTTHNPLPYIAATRKTPWMSLDKKAVAVGGGLTHRLSLSDGIIIKDNHISSIRNIYRLQDDTKIMSTIIDQILPYTTGQLTEIEVETENQAFAVFKKLSNISSEDHFFAIIIDNFSPINAKKMIRKLREDFNLSKIIIEASGGINDKNIKKWMDTGVDIISIGSLTHSTQAANLSLELA